MRRKLILKCCVAGRSLRDVAKLLAARADSLLERTPVGGALKVFADAKLAGTIVLDRKTIRTSFGQITPPLGSATLVARTILEARAGPGGLDLVFDRSYEVHLVTSYEGATQPTRRR